MPTQPYEPQLEEVRTQDIELQHHAYGEKEIELMKQEFLGMA